jgi:hypothetical protein
MRAALIKDGVVENLVVPGDAAWTAAMEAQGYQVVHVSDTTPVQSKATYDGTTFTLPVVRRIMPSITPPEVTFDAAALTALLRSRSAADNVAAQNEVKENYPGLEGHWQRVPRNIYLNLLSDYLGASSEAITDSVIWATTVTYGPE